jgi:hypothetical protein
MARFGGAGRPTGLRVRLVRFPDVLGLAAFERGHWRLWLPENPVGLQPALTSDAPRQVHGARDAVVALEPAPNTSWAGSTARSSVAPTFPLSGRKPSAAYVSSEAGASASNGSSSPASSRFMRLSASRRRLRFSSCSRSSSRRSLATWSHSHEQQCASSASYSRPSVGRAISTRGSCATPMSSLPR